MPTFSRAHSFTAHTNASASDQNDNWGGLETFLNTTKLDADNLQASAQPNNSVYRLLLEAKGGLLSASTAGTYILAGAQAGGSAASGASTIVASNVIQAIPPVLPLVANDHDVSGLNQKLQLRAFVAVNGTAPAINFTFGLYPVTVSGATTNMAYTLGTVVSGSTVAITTPGANAFTPGTPATNITPPSDGMYAIGCVTSGSMAVNSEVLLYGYLQSNNA